MKAFVIDAGICNGCYCCQIACKDEHVGNDWTPYAKQQPDTGHFWTKVEEKVRGTVPKVKISYMHHMCQHCDDAPCMKACRQNAIYKRDDGIVIIDPTKCTGQRNCIDACPYKVIYFNNDLNIAQKCTWCAHLLDKGWKEPRCVDACPTEALKFGEESELKTLISRSEALDPKVKASPRVYYLNIPKKFIAGTVYDPVEKEVIIGATVTLSQSGSKKTYTAKTDSYGDFEFEKLPVGKFTVAIEKGKKSKEIKVDTKEDISLGDIPLT